MKDHVLEDVPGFRRLSWRLSRQLATESATGRQLSRYELFSKNNVPIYVRIVLYVGRHTRSCSMVRMSTPFAFWFVQKISDPARRKSETQAE